MGPNGSGKCTLLKLLTHKLQPTTGTVTDQPNFVLAYFGQHSTAELDLEQTAMEWMQTQFPGEPTGALRNHLGKTGVVGTVGETRMKSLSYSQRSCIIFAKLTYVCPHLLILDEPTNFLDLESVDSLISACNKYKGALLLVSHKLDFLRKCAKKYVSVVPGHFDVYDNMKTAESATYTFIAEMEEGGAVKMGSDALAVGGSLASLQGGKKVEKKKEEGPKREVINGVMTLNISSSGASKSSTSVSRPAAKKEAVEYKVNEKCEALWTDGKYYPVEIKKIDPAKKLYTVTYTQYGNSAALTIVKLRKKISKAAAARK